MKIKTFFVEDSALRDNEPVTREEDGWRIVFVRPSYRLMRVYDDDSAYSDATKEIEASGLEFVCVREG